MNLLPRFIPQTDEQRQAELERKLLRREAQIGGQLFGPVPKGHNRQFFCLDQYTWIWHEEWLDENRKRHVVTTRYDVRPNGVLKQQDGQTYQPISREEARNLYRAVQQYRERVEADFASLTKIA
jgi:hypothetical protein